MVVSVLLSLGIVVLAAWTWFYRKSVASVMLQWSALVLLALMVWSPGIWPHSKISWVQNPVSWWDSVWNFRTPFGSVESLHWQEKSVNIEVDELVTLPKYPYFKSAEFNGLKSKSIQYVQIDHPKQIRFGAPLPIRLKVKADGLQQWKLVLSSEVIELETFGDTLLTVSFLPKRIGLLNGEVLHKVNSEWISEGHFGLEVLPQERLRIIMAEEGAGFGMRQVFDQFKTEHDLLRWVHLGKEVHHYTYSGEVFSAQRPTQFQRSLLQKADVLILDEQKWNTLSRQERQAVHTEIKAGLGVIFTFSNEKQVQEWNRTFGLFIPTIVGDSKTTEQVIDWSGNLSTPVRVFADARYLKTNEDTQSLIWDAYGRVKAIVHSLESGRVVFMLPIPLEELITRGNPESFSSIWSSLLNAVNRPSASAFIQHPHELQFEHEVQSLYLFNHSSNAEWLIEHASGSYRVGTLSVSEKTQVVHWFPLGSGWHTLSRGDELKTSIFIQSKNDFAAAQQVQRLKELYFRMHHQQKATEAAFAPIPPLLLLALIITCWMLVWFRERN